jgi:alcohol dehydrogenase YqhD (iron-dependent ADH family)
MVVTNEETDDKFGVISKEIMPRVSFLDPTLTYSVSKEYTAYSGVDAISHTIEGYLTHKNWAPVQERRDEGLVKAIIEATNRVLENPEDYDARAAFMWAATLATNGLSTAGFEGHGGVCHMMGHPLGALYDLPHGVTLSIVIPAFMTWALEKGNPNIEMFARNIFGITTTDPVKAAQEGIEQFKNWCMKIGSPLTVSEAGVENFDMDSYLGRAVELAGLWGLKDYDRETIRTIMSNCL